MTSSQDIHHYFDFLSAMTQKEFKGRYKQASFGFLWVLINPILQMLIIGTVFSFFFNIDNYYLFIFTGLLPWQFFSQSLSTTTPSFVNQRTLLKKAVFPKTAIPISIIVANSLNLLIILSLLILLLLILNQPLSLSLLLLIPTLIWFFSFTVGISLLTASLNVKYRDITFFVQSLLMLWFYATPILYQLNVIPQQFLPLYQFNPLSSIFELFHHSLLNYPPPPTNLLATNLGISMLIIVLGIIIYKKQHRFFVDWL